MGWVWPQSADHLALLQNELEDASRVGEGEPDVTVAGHYLGARPRREGTHPSPSAEGTGQSIATGTPPPGTEAGGAGGFPRHTGDGTTVSTSLLCRRGDGQGRKYRRRAKGSQKARTRKLAFFGPRVNREGEALNKATLPYRDGGHEPPGLFKFVKIK